MGSARLIGSYRMIIGARILLKFYVDFGKWTFISERLKVKYETIKMRDRKSVV